MKRLHSTCSVLIALLFAAQVAGQDSFGSTQSQKQEAVPNSLTQTLRVQPDQQQTPNSQPVPDNTPSTQLQHGPSTTESSQFTRALQMETRDFGVSPTTQLVTNLHGPTPLSIPGGSTINTSDLYQAIQQYGNQIRLFDVLGSGVALPGALSAYPASAPGSFNDDTQRQFGDFLTQVTYGHKNTPLVFYCQGTSCWMSYNAALRAINLGYQSVYWYRGGVEAWQMAGLDTQP